MRSFIEYEYRCKGDSEQITKSATAIEVIKNKYAEWSGNGNFNFDNEVEIGGLGESLSWTCYATCDMEDIDSKLIELTASGQMTLFIYQGCTDGTNDGRLLTIVGGNVVSDIRCDADIGMQSMMDMDALQGVEDSKALGRLITSFKEATSEWDPALFAAEEEDDEDDADDEDDEDDDGDYADISRAGVLAAAIGDTLGMYPAMLNEPVHAKALVSLAAQANMARHWMFKYELASVRIKKGINAMVSKVESLQLAAEVKKPKVKFTASTSHTVRL